MSASNSSLELTMPSDREIVMTRFFDAPRELLWKAHTDPNLIPQWWGPRYFTTTVDKMEVKPGGVWRFVSRAPDGMEFAFNGVFREIQPPERLVWTFEFEGVPGQISLQTVTFERQSGGTKLTVTILCETAEDRDGILKSGMEEGYKETTDRLEELLSKLE